MAKTAERTNQKMAEGEALDLARWRLLLIVMRGFYERCWPIGMN